MKLTIIFSAILFSNFVFAMDSEETQVKVSSVHEVYSNNTDFKSERKLEDNDSVVVYTEKGEISLMPYKDVKLPPFGRYKVFVGLNCTDFNDDQKSVSFYTCIQLRWVYDAQAFNYPVLTKLPVK